MSGTTFDRRELIVGAGALAVAASLPVALAAAEPAVGDAMPRATLTDWHIDDMWGVYPRPHEAIGYGRPRGDGELAAAAAPADLPFLCA
jgi:hypothetical protein